MKGFLAEVKEQGAALREAARSYREREGRLLEDAARAVGDRPILFAGMGSSWAAALAAETFLVKRGRPAVAVDCAEALYRWLSVMAGPRGFAPVLISQSGESREVVRLASSLAVPFVAITNEPASTLGKAAAVALPMHAGREAGTTNKTFTNTIAVSLLLARAVLSPHDRAASMAGPLDIAAAAVDGLLAGPERAVGDLLAHLTAGSDGGAGGDDLPWELIGRGSAMAAVHQAALALRELSGRVIVPFHGSFYRHGPVYRSTARTRAVILASLEEEGDLLARLASEIIGRGGRVAFISDFEPDVASPLLHAFRLPAVEGSVFPILAAIPLELLGAADARARGFAAGGDVPKVTAVE